MNTLNQFFGEYFVQIILLCKHLLHPSFEVLLFSSSKENK